MTDFIGLSPRVVALGVDYTGVRLVDGWSAAGTADQSQRHASVGGLPILDLTGIRLKRSKRRPSIRIRRSIVQKHFERPPHRHPANEKPFLQYVRQMTFLKNTGESIADCCRQGQKGQRDRQLVRPRRKSSRSFRLSLRPVAPRIREHGVEQNLSTVKFVQDGCERLEWAVAVSCGCEQNGSIHGSMPPPRHKKSSGDIVRTDANWP